MYDNEAVYTVALAKPVQVGSRKLLPRDSHSIKGDVLNKIVAEFGEASIASAALPSDAGA